MPEFVLDMGSREGAKTFQALELFARGYIEAAFFTNTGYRENEDLEHASFVEIAPSALEKIIQDCAAWQTANADLLSLAYDLDYDATQAGRDYWFTRNGHGVGFWDRKQLDVNVYKLANNDFSLAPDAFNAKMSKTLGELLSDRCRYSEVYLYRGDDGLIYFE